jgi:predicted phage tail protein
MLNGKSGLCCNAFSWNFVMTDLGLSMIVGGTAFLLSGLIFLLPTAHKQSAREQPFEEAQNEIEFYLARMRNKSG